MRFGFAVKILGEPGLKSHDTRRWQSAPHLRVSIACLRGILEYLNRMDIRMYRISSDFAPYAAHPELLQFRGQIDECLGELAEVGARAREYGIRLSFHPSLYIALNSPDDRVVRRAAEDIQAQARILDAMNQGPEAVVVIHVGGVYGDKQSGVDRFGFRYEALPEAARRRLVLENDESRYSIADVLEISGRVGIPAVFDYLHHMNNHPRGLLIREAIEQALLTWPAGVIPKIHFSSPRTELRVLERRAPVTGIAETVRPPLASQHSDYINPYEFGMFAEKLHGLPDFDIMLEAKAKDLALLRLRTQLREMGSPISG